LSRFQRVHTPDGENPIDSVEGDPDFEPTNAQPEGHRIIIAQANNFAFARVGESLDRGVNPRCIPPVNLL